MFSAPVDTAGQLVAVGIVSAAPASFGPFVGCTGTLIAPDLVLTASHCVVDIARGCDGAGNPQLSLAVRKETLLAKEANNFYISPSGVLESDFASTSFPIDDVAIHPAAYIPVGTCSTSCDPTTSACIDCKTADFNPFIKGGPSLQGGNAESDMAILHLAKPVPGSLAMPIQVVTDISDPSPTPGTPWKHLNLQSSDFASGSKVLPTVVGWGDSDSCPSTRRFGQALFSLDSNWDQACADAALGAMTWSCEGPGTSNACNIDGISGDRQLAAIAIHRMLPRGPVVGLGDSGGPLIVSGGDSGGGFGDITPQGVPFVLGVLSRGGGTGSPCGTALPDGQDFPAIYSATFAPVNARWIEKTMVDFDGDGQPNRIDNCPTVPNFNQQDTNFDAEKEIQLAPPGCVDIGGCPPDEGDVPTPTDSDAYVAHWQRFYPGDACDTTATTATAPVRVKDPEGRTAPCNVCNIIGGQVESCAPSATKTCPAFLTSGISFTSYIGDSLGGAQNATGMSAGNAPFPVELRVVAAARFGSYATFFSGATVAVAGRRAATRKGMFA